MKNNFAWPYYLGSLGNGCSIRMVNSILIMVNDYVIIQRFRVPIRDVPPSIVCQKFNKCLDFHFFIIHKAVHPKAGGLQEQYSRALKFLHSKIQSLCHKIQFHTKFMQISKQKTYFWKAQSIRNLKINVSISTGISQLSIFSCKKLVKYILFNMCYYNYPSYLQKIALKCQS